MKVLYTLFLLILFNNIILKSQNLTVIATPTESFCSSNGSISIQVSGGTAPYTYSFVTAPSGVNRPPQSSNVFSLLPQGNYTIAVSDANNLKATTDTQITSNYSEPTLTNIVIVGNRATLIASGGRPPYRYALSADGGTTYTSPVNNNVFDCLTEGDYFFRIFDSCDNFYSSLHSISNSILDFTVTCQNSSSQGISINMRPVNNDGAPYVFVVYRETGDSILNQTGEFRGLTDCRFTIGIYDKCGRRLTKPFECTDNPLQLTINCSNASNGSASLVAQGGRPPYRFVETTSNITSQNGNFTGLPLGQKYNFEVTDFCGKKKQASISTLRITDTLWVGCPFNGDATIKASQILVSDTACTSACNTYSFNPVRFTCPTCPISSPNEVNGSAKEASSFIYRNLPEGQHRIIVSNGCNDTTSTVVNISRQLIPLTIVPDCNESQITVSVPTVGTTYVFKDANGTRIDSNTTGTFKIPYVGRFVMEARNASCLQNSVPINDFEKPTVKLKFQGCDSIAAVPCPNVANFSYILRGGSGNLIDSNKTGIFWGLTKNTDYRIILYNPRFVDSIVLDFKTDQLPVLTAENITCSSVCLRFNTSSWANQGSNPVIFNLKDASGRIVVSNTTGCFRNLNVGTNYTGEAIHPTCGVSTTTFTTLPGSIAGFCATPSTSTINGKCSFGWNIKLKPFANIYTLENSTKSIRINNNTGEFNNLVPGNYILLTECSRDSVILPESGLELDAIAGLACPNAATIRATGARTDSAWVAWGKARSIDICSAGTETYEIRDLVGTLIATSNTGSFVGLPSATTYIVGLVRGGCTIDTQQVTTNLYTRGELSTTFGIICPPATTGSIRSFVTGGNAPYTFEITSPRGVAPSVVTDSTNIVFNNLPGGNYVFRVSDKCGISSNLTGTVSNFNFTPQYRRICGGIVELQVPTIDSVTYVWTNNANQNIGSSSKIRVTDRAANRYTVVINSMGCNYTTSVDVPAQTQPDIISNAGIDRVLSGNTTRLQADSLQAGVTGRWRQIIPSSGNTTIATPTDPRSNITVTQTPGRYTYIWEINGGNGSCISSDTVIYTFCPAVNTFTINIDSTLSRCDRNTGTINIKAKSSSNIDVRFRWSNGRDSSFIDRLAPSVYRVTITDGLTCTQPVVRDVTIRNPTIVLNTTKTNIRCFGENNGKVQTRVQSTINKYGFKWSNGSTDSVLVNLKAGQYTVTVTDTLNCNQIDTATVVEPPTWDLLTLTDTVLAIGDTLQLKTEIVPQSQNRFTWSWSPADFLTCKDCQIPTLLRLNESQIFRLIAEDNLGCMKQKDIKVIVDPTTGIFTPNIFSPNGDGSNDYFMLYSKTRIRNIKRMRVFNRWGNLVFEKDNISPNDETNGWNGTSNGSILNPDVYVYWAEVEYVNGLTSIIKGDITLVR